VFGTNGLIIWLLGGAGTFLLYSSISNQKPQDVLGKYLGSPTKNPTPISSWTDPNAPAGTPGSNSHIEAPGPLGSTGGLDNSASYDSNGLSSPLPAAYINNPNNLVQA
jgi:hypothetical protein